MNVQCIENGADRQLAPMYIIEGMPGNAYSYDDTSVFKDYTLVHDNETLGFCMLNFHNKTHMSL